MNQQIQKEGRFKYIETGGRGDNLLLLHGLFGALSNFESIIRHFGERYNVVVPILPIMELPLRKLSVMGLVEYVADLILTHQARVRLTRDRTSKNGDYRPPDGRLGHRISVNQTLNPYAMLVTLLHEFAHLRVWEQHNGSARPHGIEWKRAFADIMEPVLHEGVFPSNLLTVLKRYLRNPAASSCSDPHLMEALSAHNPPSEYDITLRALPAGTRFVTKKGGTYCKGELRRTRCLCVCQETGRRFLILASARVRPLN